MVRAKRIRFGLRGEFRKAEINNDELTLAELELMAQRIFKLSPSDSFKIKYQDEDDVMVTIGDDTELKLAMDDFEILKLLITMNEELQEMAVANNTQQPTEQKPLQNVQEFDPLSRPPMHRNSQSGPPSSASPGHPGPSQSVPPAPQQYGGGFMSSPNQFNSPHQHGMPSPGPMSGPPPPPQPQLQPQSQSQSQQHLPPVPPPGPPAPPGPPEPPGPQNQHMAGPPSLPHQNMTSAPPLHQPQHLAGPPPPQPPQNHIGSPGNHLTGHNPPPLPHQHQQLPPPPPHLAVGQPPQYMRLPTVGAPPLQPPSTLGEYTPVSQDQSRYNNPYAVRKRYPS